jgi:hypothetical protein
VEVRTGRLCTHRIGLLTLSQRESKRRTGQVVFVHTDSGDTLRTIGLEGEDRTGRLCIHGVTLRAIGLLTLSQRESKIWTEQVVCVLPWTLSGL